MAAEVMGDHVMWEESGQLELRRRLSISDTSYFYDEPLIVPVTPGNYVVSAAYGETDGIRHVRCFRVMLCGVELRSRRPGLGEVIVDFGQVGICDRDAAEAAFESLGEHGMDDYHRQLDYTDLSKWVHLPGPTLMWSARPAYGDGVYPAYDLRDQNSKRIGVEVSFVQNQSRDR